MLVRGVWQRVLAHTQHGRKPKLCVHSSCARPHRAEYRDMLACLAIATLPLRMQLGGALEHASAVSGLSWSADGLELAVSCGAAEGQRASVCVWALRSDGGLGSQPASRYVAAAVQ